MKLLSLTAAAMLAGAGLTVVSNIAEAKADADIPLAEVSAPLVVAELFTSQSCSSCPPAEALFATLADDENLLTLEWHVDYWDTLIHGGSKWKDPYSNKVYTARQRSYNQSLRGTRAVYTPQAIVNGDTEGVGNRRAAVTGLVAEAAALPLSVRIENGTVVVDASEMPVEVSFIRLLKQHETNVKGGENKGRKLHGKNIVLDAETLGTTEASPTQFELPRLETGETCAVLVQSLGDDLGPILGAAKCE